MHVKSLKVFCDVVGRRSFSRAADENQISQSGASQTVHQLEEHLGVKLIDRSKRPFVLTPEGEVYYEGCRKLVHRLFALEEEVRTLHQEVEGRVQVASIYSVGLSYGRTMVNEFKSRHPKAEIRLEFHHPDRVYELIEEGQVDLGLVSYAHSTRTIKTMTWLEEPMILVCAADHPLASLETVSFKDLNRTEMIGFDPDLTIRRKIDRELQSRQIDVQVTMAFDNIDSIKRAIKVNSGASFLPRATVNEEIDAGQFVAVPLTGFTMSRPLGILRRRGVELGKTARRLLKLLQDTSVFAMHSDNSAFPESDTDDPPADGNPFPETLPYAAAVNDPTSADKR